LDLLPQQEVEEERATKELHQQAEEQKPVLMHYPILEIQQFQKTKETQVLLQQDFLVVEEAEEAILLVHLVGTVTVEQEQQEELSAA
jgi:hypothetical protein